MRMMEKEYAKAIAPRACKLLHIFCVAVTVPACVTVPMLIPSRLPLMFPLSANKKGSSYSYMS